MTKEMQDIKCKIRKILERHKVTKAGIFGSYVRGEQEENSDVDILVELKIDSDLVDFIKIKNELEWILKRKVDLVEYDTIREELKENILKEEVQVI